MRPIGPIRSFDSTLIGHFNSHAAGGPANHTGRHFHRRGIHVVELDFGNVEHLSFCHLANFIGLGVGRALRDLRSLLEQDGSRRALRDELERPVTVDRHDDRNRRPLHLFRAIVELHHELTDIDPMGPQGSSHGRRRRSLSSRNLNFDLSCDRLFCHRACLSANPPIIYIETLKRRLKPAPQPFLPLSRTSYQTASYQTASTCQYSNSTGVDRPKISINTFTRPLASSTVSTVPSKLSNVPSLIFTRSPGAKSILIFG